MQKQAILAVSFALLSPSFGLAQKVRTDYDHRADFTQYHTFRLVKIADNPAVNQLADERILTAIRTELTNKGMMQVTTGGDVLVGYQGSIDKQTQYTTFNDGFGPGWGWGPGWGGSSISTTTASTIPIGALTIDMMDPARKQLIFRGTATDTLSDKPEKNAEKIKKAVAKIFDKYPPKPKG